MASITKDTTNHIWNFTDTITSTPYNVVFDTQNKFLDAKIKAALTVQSGAITPILGNTNLNTYFDAGTAGNNSISITPKATNTGGFITAHGNNDAVTGAVEYYIIKTGEGQAGTANVTLVTTDGTNAGTNISSIVDTENASTTEPNTTGTYYLAFKGSGNSKIKTAGWFTAGTALTTASKTLYFPIDKATLTVSKVSGTITPSASLSQTNVTLSASDTSGISITATGNGSVSNLSIKANVSEAGYIPTGDVATASNISIAAASSAATETKYITGVTVPASKTFAVTNSGTTTVTAGISGSTTQGVINIVAYPASGTTATASQKIVNNGRWVETTISAANTWYYGKVKAGALTVTTSSTNTNMSTYFDSLSSSSGASVTITPKYTNTAGFKTALTTATNNGGTTYWKIKTTSVTQNKNTTLKNDNTEIDTRANASWGTGWISEGTISPATFANSATADVTYVDISATSAAPILISGDYLYINRGYVDNLKISLAKLIPDTLDGTNINFASANYILTGYAAFNAAGAQITGTMQIYNGAYTVS